MNRFAMEEPDVDRYSVNERQRDDEAREQRWAEFVDDVRGSGNARGWSEVVIAVGATMRHGPVLGFERILAAFAETEGWSGVLSAIAQALREDEQARNELLDRR